jgi:hypothetical protein
MTVCVPPIPGTKTDVPANGTDRVMLDTGNVDGEGIPAPNYDCQSGYDRVDIFQHGRTLIIPGISLYGFNSFKADRTLCFDSKLKYRSKSISTGAGSIDGIVVVAV